MAVGVRVVIDIGLSVEAGVEIEVDVAVTTRGALAVGR